MLIGNYHHLIQAKGRLAIPPAFRHHLGDKPILTRGVETCLQLLPFNTWKKLTADLGSHPFSGPNQRQLRRLLAHQAFQVKYDSQGRILIPDNLRQPVSLSKRVVVAGSIDWVEIWDLDIYTDYMHKLDKLAPEIIKEFEKIQKKPEEIRGDQNIKVSEEIG